MAPPDSVVPMPQDMRGRYEASQDLLGTLRKQLSDSEGERRGLEEQLQRLRDKSDGATRAQEDAQREAQRLRSAIDLLNRCLGGRKWGPRRMNQCQGPTPAQTCKRAGLHQYGHN